MTRNCRKMIKKMADSLLLSKYSIQFSALFLLLSAFFFWKNLHTYYIHYKTRNMAPTIYCIKYIFLPSPPSKSVSSLTTIVLDISIVYFVWKIRVKMMQEPISSIITKVEMAKVVKTFCHFKCKNLLPFEGANSIERVLWTCNLWTSWLQDP